MEKFNYYCISFFPMILLSIAVMVILSSVGLGSLSNLGSGLIFAYWLVGLVGGWMGMVNCIWFN